MSDERIVIETPCKHGNYYLNCRTLLCVNYNHIHSISDGCFCSGGHVLRFTANHFVDLVDGLVQGSIDALGVPNLILAPGEALLDALSTPEVAEHLGGGE